MKKAIMLSLVMSLALGVFLGGCVDNDRSLTIEYTLQADKDCVVESADGTVWDYGLFSGSLDLAHPFFAGEPRYYLSLQVRNNLPAEPTTCPTCGTNNYDVQIDRIEVRYSFEKGREIVEGLAPSLLLLEDQAEMLPAGGSMPAEGLTVIAGIPVISPQVGALLYSLGEEADQVVLGVSVKIIGTTLGGQRIESNDYMLRLYLCWAGLRLASCSDGSYPGCFPGQEPAPDSCQ